MIRQRYTPGGAFAGTWDEVDEPVLTVAGVDFPSGVVDGLGEDHVRYLASQPYPGAVCQSRARGAWAANDLALVGLYLTAAACFAVHVVLSEQP